MATVAELSDPYANFMYGPRAGSGVCAVCFNFTRSFEHCYRCARDEPLLSAVLPISYSVGGEQLHHALLGYKRLHGELARRMTLGLAAVLWRFLEVHERCVAAASGVRAFDLVTTVPSGERSRDDGHPLRRVVGRLVGPTRRTLRSRCSAARRSPLQHGRSTPVSSRRCAARRRTRAADRRHLDHGFECPQRRSGPPPGGEPAPSPRW